MTPKEVQERLGLGEHPLDVAIIKWRGIVEAGGIHHQLDEHGNLFMAHENCGLCCVYTGCYSCPARGASGDHETCCNGLYAEWASNPCVETAQAVLDFLISLKEKEEK